MRVSLSCVAGCPRWLISWGCPRDAPLSRYSFFSPYPSYEDDLLAVASQLQIDLLIFQALMIKVDVSEQGTYSHETFGALMAFCIIGPMIVGFIICLGIEVPPNPRARTPADAHRVRIRTHTHLETNLAGGAFLHAVGGREQGPLGAWPAQDLLLPLRPPVRPR